MLIRYKKEGDGKNRIVAKVYGPDEHKIDNQGIDKDALWVVKKLNGNGFEAYIVGGAVRDLLIKQIPKDFDIATNATPRQIQKLFWNARIIGKRFKLVHLFFRDNIIEVSTFRSGSSEFSKLYGSVDQDAKRRDFTLNGLYYEPIKRQLIDFHEALEDISKKTIRSILPLPDSFIEDPVRMIRAIKYSATTNFKLQNSIRRSIVKYGKELSKVPASRLTEELLKIFGSSQSERIIKDLLKYNLLIYILPTISLSPNKKQLYESLAKLDKITDDKNENKKIKEGGWNFVMIKALTENLIIFPVEEMSGDLLFKEIYSQIKSIINPITPPNYYVQQATVELLKERNIVVPKSCLSAKKPLDVTLYGQPKQKSKKELESLKRAKKAHRVAPKKRAKTTVQSRYSPD